MIYLNKKDRYKEDPPGIMRKPQIHSYYFGDGYPVKELMQLDLSISIEVYEADINILKLAAAYPKLANLINKLNVKLIYDPLHKYQPVRSSASFW
jgi:hypothetical protein